MPIRTPATESVPSPLSGYSEVVAGRVRSPVGRSRSVECQAPRQADIRWTTGPHRGTWPRPAEFARGRPCMARLAAPCRAPITRDTMVRPAVFRDGRADCRRQEHWPKSGLCAGERSCHHVISLRPDLGPGMRDTRARAFRSLRHATGGMRWMGPQSRPGTDRKSAGAAVWQAFEAGCVAVSAPAAVTGARGLPPARGAARPLQGRHCGD